MLAEGLFGVVAGGIVNLAVVEARCGAVEGVDSHSGDTRHLPPNAERAITQRAMVGGADEVPPNAEQVQDDAVN